MVSLPADDGFFVLGDILTQFETDTTPKIYSFVAKLDYEGNVMYSHYPLNNDSINQYFFRRHHPAWVNNKGNIETMFVGFDEGNSYAKAHFVEFDPEENQILKDVKIDDPDDPFSGYLLRYSKLEFDSIYIHVGQYIENNINGIEVVETNFSYEIIKRFKFLDTLYDIAPHYINKTNNNLYKIIGTLFKREYHEDPQPAYIFYLLINSNGDPVMFNMLNTDHNYIYGLGDTYSTINGDKGSYVVLLSDYISCSDDYPCYNSVPYFISSTDSLKTVNWESRFLDDNIYISDSILYLLHYGIRDLSNSGFLGLGSRIVTAGSEEGHYSSSILFKVSNAGDSLWFSHFVPLGWEPYRGVLLILKDIHPTPYNTYILSGYVLDRDDGLTKPWILQLDKDGCLIPGCHDPSGVDEQRIQTRPFTLYPNPASGYLNIQSWLEEPTIVSLQLIDLSGRVIDQADFESLYQYQYTLPLSGFPPGSYFVQFVDSKGKVLQTEAIMIE